jgi:TMEM175 potassium channel family protein
METRRRVTLGRMRVARMEAFSDGVLAIVITLLILDVKVPTGVGGHLGRALAEQWPQYAAYLVSFFIVGIIWLNHHATIQLLARTDHRLLVLNLLLLLPVSVLPWPTAVLAEYLRDGTAGDQRVAVVLYGLANCAMAVTFNVLWHYLLRHPELRKPDVSPELLAVRNRRFNIGLVLYPVTTLIGLFSTWAFLAIVFALALLYLLPTPDVRGAAPEAQP